MKFIFNVGRSGRIARQAARWHAEMEEPASTAQIATFEAWLKADPAHLSAYQQLDTLAELGAHWSLAEQAAHRSNSGTQRYRPAFALAATVVAALGLWWLVREPTPAYAAIANHGQATRIVGLRDGSIVTMDVASTIEVAANPSTRRLRLLSGRIRVDGRNAIGPPISVTVPAGEIISIAGVVDVAAAGDDVRAWVISGNARVSAWPSRQPSGTIELRSSQGVKLQGGVATRIPWNGRETTWPQAHMAFNNDTLAKILAIANQIGTPHIMVADRATGTLRVTGVLDLRDTRKLARKLAAALDLNVTERDGTLILMR